MARISKRNHISGSTENTVQGSGQRKTQGAKYYKAGIYARLSADQGPKTCGQASKNESIETQIGIAEKYVEDWNQHHKDKIVIVNRYTDLGKTGTNFDRDAFKMLMQDVRLGDINCVIVKDLSRFGRNYLEAGNYIEKIFPFLGVRFIAVNDRIDTDNPASFDYLSLHLKNLVNDVYARDISAKIGTVLHEKQERGEFIGAWAAYGYQRSREDKHRLVIDEKTAPVVKDIFAWRLAGSSYGDIVRKLTEQGIPSPSKYRYMTGLVHHKRFMKTPWRVETIRWIVGNEVYLGHTVQGRRRESLFLGERRKSLQKNKWIVVENTHEAIVEQSIFNQVQQINQTKRQERKVRVKSLLKEEEENE